MKLIFITAEDLECYLCNQDPHGIVDDLLVCISEADLQAQRRVDDLTRNSELAAHTHDNLQIMAMARAYLFEQALHTLLRDDTALRALLGQRPTDYLAELRRDYFEDVRPTLLEWAERDSDDASLGSGAIILGVIAA